VQKPNIILVVLLLTALTVTCSCQSDSQSSARPDTDASSKSTTTMPSDLAGMWFISKEKLEVGLGPGPEPVLGHWHLRFDDDHVHWQYSDTEVTPSYVLLPNGTIEVKGMSIQARYVPERDEILWDGRWYMLNQSHVCE